MRKFLLFCLLLLIPASSLWSAEQPQNLVGWSLVFKRIINKDLFPRVYYFPQGLNSPQTMSQEQWNTMVAGHSAEVTKHMEYFLQVKMDDGKELSFVAKIEKTEELEKLGVKEYFPPGEYQAETAPGDIPAESNNVTAQAPIEPPKVEAKPAPAVKSAPVPPMEVKTPASEPGQVLAAADQADQSQAQVQTPPEKSISAPVEAPTPPVEHQEYTPPAPAQEASEQAAVKSGPNENWMKTLGLGDKVTYVSESPLATTALVNLPIEALQDAIPDYLKANGWYLLNQEQGDNYATFSTDYRYRDQTLAILLPAQRRGHLEISLDAQNPQQTAVTIKLVVEFMQRTPVIEGGEVGVEGYDTSWQPDNYTNHPEAFISYYRESICGIVVQQARQK